MAKTDKTKEWYRALRKPSWAPPSWIFGPVWTVLYLIIAISYGFVAYESYKGIVPVSILVVFVANLVFNFLYTPLQFGLRNLVLATIDILLVLGTLIAALIMIHPYFSWVSLVNIPYLLWVSFATVLQCTITFKNRDKWTT
ncbi:MAG: TspO/MBR family protein [Candidatus Paceibacterota bacterium]